MRTTCLLKVTVPSALAERLMTKRRTAAPKVLNHMGRYFTRCASVCIHPSSQKRGVCAEGADGVVRPAKRFGRTDHPGASRHPSSARRGMHSTNLENLCEVALRNSSWHLAWLRFCALP